MEIGKLGVWSPTDLLSAEQLAAFAQRIERLGYGALWYPESSRGHETFATAGFLVSHTETLVVATGIANIYARDALTMKQGQHTLAKLSGGRFLLGLGVSHIPSVEGLRGHTYGKPVATMSAYLDAMEHATVNAPPLDQPPPIVLAALGPRMTGLAAARTTGLHTYCTTPAHVAWAREKVGPGPWICAEQKVFLCKNPLKAREVARKNLVYYIALPNYRNNWLWLGFTEQELSDGGSDHFLDAMVAWGDEAAIRQRIQQYYDAGANHVCIQPLHPEMERMPDLDTLEALAP